MSVKNIRTGRRSFFINQNFLMLWIGGTISRMSQVLLLEGFGLWIIFSIVKGSAAATTAVKGSQMFAFLGLLTFGVFAGVFVDRWRNKKRVLLITAACRACSSLLPIAAALVLSFAPSSAAGTTAFAIGSIYLTILLVNSFTHFAIPASYAIFVDCVEEQDYAYANGLLLAATFSSIIVGTVLALALFNASGIYGILVLCSILYFVSFITSSRLDVEIHPETSTRKGIFREWAESIALCFKESLLTILLLGLVLINTWNGALSILSTTFLMQNLHFAFQQSPIYDANSTFYGALGVTIEIAFSVGALLFGLFARRLGEKRVFSYALFVAGLLMIVVSRLTQYTPAVVAIFLISLLAAAVNVIAVPIYLWVTPRHFLGRIRSIVDVTTNLVALVAGAICMGLLGTNLGNFHAQLSGFSFGFVDVTFTIVGLLCTVGGIVVIRSLGGAKKAVLKTQGALPEATTTSRDLNANATETGEPSISGKR